MSDTDNQNSESDLLKFISLRLAASLVLFYFSTNSLADSFVNVAWMIPVFPIVSFVAILLFGHMDSRKGGSFALAGIGLSSVFSLAIAYDVLIQDSLHGGYVESTRTWFSGATYSFDFGTYVDALAALLLLVVGLVSYLVIVFSTSYMEEEGDRQVRYFAEISLFVGIMLGLVVANSFLLMFIFWELVGVCSYLLIGFWYEKP